MEAAIKNRELALGLVPSLQTVAEDFTEVIKLLIVKYKLHELFSKTLSNEILHEVFNIDDTTINVWKLGQNGEVTDDVEFRIEIDKSDILSVTWPTSSNIGSILRYLENVAFARHNIKQIRVIAGNVDSENKLYIKEAIIEREIDIAKLRANNILDQNTKWLRFEKTSEEVTEPIFTTYISLTTQFGLTGEISIMVSRNKVTVDHLSEFIFTTAGDFLLLAPPDFFSEKIRKSLEE
jgi:hypothetical protein